MSSSSPPSSSTLYPLTATCLCQSISLSLSSPPSGIHICHCFLCRKETGSLFAVQVRFPRSAVTITRGASTLIKFSRPEDEIDAATGIRPNAAFCGKCGNPVWCEGAKMIIVRYGLLDVEEVEGVEGLLRGLKGTGLEEEGVEGKGEGEEDGKDKGEGEGTDKTEWWPHAEYFIKRRPEWAKEWKVEGAEQNWDLKGGKGGSAQG